MATHYVEIQGHLLVEGREVCPRHKGYETRIGNPCRCGLWACKCGENLGLRKSDTPIIAAEKAWEQHALSAGAKLADPETLRADLQKFRGSEERRREAAREKEQILEARLARANARKIMQDYVERNSVFFPDAKKNSGERYTVEKLAANAAIVAPVLGKDADEEHETTYAAYWSLAEKFGLDDEATTTGLTLAAWTALKGAADA